MSVHRNGNRKSVEFENKVIDLYLGCFNLGAVALEMGIYRTGVSRILKRNNIEIKENKSGKDHPNWRGGKNMNKGDGYIGIHKPGHERADGGNYVYEHTLNFEKHYGFLPKKNEVLHHIDLDKQNNEISNLYLCGHKKHLQIHRNIEKLIKPLLQRGIIEFKDGEYIFAP